MRGDVKPFLPYLMLSLVLRCTMNDILKFDRTSSVFKLYKQCDSIARLTQQTQPPCQWTPCENKFYHLALWLEFGHSMSHRQSLPALCRDEPELQVLHINQLVFVNRQIEHLQPVLIRQPPDQRPRKKGMPHQGLFDGRYNVKGHAISYPYIVVTPLRSIAQRPLRGGITINPHQSLCQLSNTYNSAVFKETGRLV